jgi:hypothetical protein
MERLEPITASTNSFVQVIANTTSGVPDAGINPTMLRRTHENQDVTVGGTVRKGLLQGAPGAPHVGTLTVANNTFTVAAEIILGDYVLVSNLDYIPGALVANTATNITAAINNLVGFTATVLGPVVTINYSRMARVPFLVRHYGAVTNFTVTPTTGWLTEGAPAIGPPALT